MRFISRFIVFPSGLKYGVFDTKTGIEDWLSEAEVMNLACQGLMGGVVVGDRQIRSSIDCWQDEKTVTSAQKKLGLLYGIKATKWKHMLTQFISLYGYETSAVVTLSNLCTSCADYILYNDRNWHKRKLTLILDDNVSFSEHTFSWFSPYRADSKTGIVVDVRLMSDSKALEMYKMLLREIESPQMCLECILDDGLRKQSMMRLLVGD